MSDDEKWAKIANDVFMNLKEEDADWIFCKAIDLYLEEKDLIMSYINPNEIKKDDPWCAIFKEQSNYFEADTFYFTSPKIKTPD